MFPRVARNRNSDGRLVASVDGESIDNGRRVVGAIVHVGEFRTTRMHLRDVAAEFHEADPRRPGRTEATRIMILDAHWSRSVRKRNNGRFIQTCSQPGCSEAEDMPDDNSIGGWSSKHLFFRTNQGRTTRSCEQIQLGNALPGLFSCAAE